MKKLNLKKTSEKETEQFTINISESVTNVRSIWRKASSEVSDSIDAAVVAGGLDKSIKAIQKKTDDLHDQISRSFSAIEQIAANVNRFNGVIEKQDIALTQVTEAVEKMSVSVDNVTDVTKKKLDAAGGLREIIGKGGESVLTTANAISEVTSAINAVADVIKVIDNIAAQTNLLAMNAAIEAAHAGEYGKGFAVVASEVRKLAESTTANSKAIDDSLKRIVNQIKEARTAGQTASDTFDKIQKEVEIFFEAFMEISQSTSNLSVGTTDIVETMEDLSQVSHQISSGSREIVTGVENVDSSLKIIKDFSHGLQEDMSVIEKNAFDISGSQSGIAQYMVDTTRGVDNFFKDMERAKYLEKEKMRFNYDMVLLMHRNWLIQLRAFLDDRKQGLKATTEDHLKCDLGKWIYGDGKQFEGSSTYGKLEERHKSFHLKAGDIIRAKTGNNKQLAESGYQELMNYYKEIVSLLDKLRNE